MNSPYQLIPKFTSLVAMGACLLAANPANAADVISAGYQFGGAISGGKLRTWGLNDQGQLGQGENAPNPNALPTEISDTVNYSAVEAGPDFMFGVTQDGALRAWGNNANGQLGVGDLSNRESPATVNFPSGVGAVVIADVVAGSTHALAIDMNGFLYAWGDTNSGQLGISNAQGIGFFVDPVPESTNDTFVERPLQVLNFSEDAVNTWIDVAAGQEFSAGIKTDGTLWVWGGAAPGIAGNVALPNQIATSITDWVEVEAGLAHVIARRSNGEIYTWGNNAAGQLGLGQTVNSRNAPTKVGSKSDWIFIGTGGLSTFAIDSTNTLYAWGYNLSEELGQPFFLDGNFQPVNAILYRPVILSEGNTFTVVDGGRASPEGSLEQFEGFTLTSGTVRGDTGFFTLGGNLQGQLGVGSVTFDSTETPQRAAADGLQISISNPTINETEIGVNTMIDVDVTVSNGGSVGINIPYLVELFLSTDKIISPEDTPLADVTFENTLPEGASNQIKFQDVEIADLNSGAYFILSRVSFAGAPTDTNSDIQGETAITIIRPSFVLDNPVFQSTRINVGEQFTNVDITLRNNTIGVVPQGENIVLEVYLLEDLTFDPVTDEVPSSAPQLLQIDYMDGLNSQAAPEGAEPPRSVTFSNLILTPPTNLSSREDYLILFAVNRDGAIGEETGQTDDNFRTQRVVIASPDPVAPAINFGDVIGVGALGEWLPVFDQFALNNNALQSPSLTNGQSSSFELEVAGPTTVTAPWTINADEADVLMYELLDANDMPIEASGGGNFSESIAGYNPTYQPIFIVVDVNSPLYDETPASAPYPWTIRWTYTQGSNFGSSVARVDLEIPSFVPDPETFGFIGTDDVTAPSGDDRVAGTLNSMAQNDVAVLKFDYDLTDNALVKFWWRTTGEVDLDTLTFSVDGVVQALPTTEFGATAQSSTISGDTEWRQVAFIVPAGPRTLRWEFTKGSTELDAGAYIDALEVLQPLPEFNLFNRENPNPDLLPVLTNVGGGPGFWNIIDPSPGAPNNQAVGITDPGPGTQETFSFDLPDAVPSVVFAPWMVTGNAGDSVSYILRDAENDIIQAAGGGDFIVTQTGPTIGFNDVSIFIDANSPLYDADETDEPYPWSIEWTFSQSGPNPASAQVAVTPYNFQNIPISNVDTRIESVTATPGTYILDDANGSGRLPITVSMKNVGADFVSTPPWDPTNLQIRLSIDQVFGNSDDIDIGSNAQVTMLPSNDQVVFQADINLPFNTPEGNYFILLRFDSAFGVGEFTLANNSRTVGPNFVIVRAPNLVIRNIQSFSPSYPWRPEQSSFIRYNIANTGLGDVTTDQNFDVIVSLHGKLASQDFDASAQLIKAYDPVPNSLFLPEASAQFPNGSSQQVTHFLEIPSMRDMLVGLGIIPAGTPEDSIEVYNNIPLLGDFEYYFTINVDATNNVLESSETNLFFATNFFNIVPVEIPLINLNDNLFYSPTENYGFYVGQSPFTPFTIRADNPLTIPFDPDPNDPITLGDSDLDGYSNLQEYAFATDPTSAASPNFDPTLQNGIIQLNIPPNGDSNYLSVTFDFNVRMTDMRMIVEATDDMNNLVWDELVVIEPPYLDASGSQSLTGFGGLISDPRVVSLIGNVTDVQNVYSARITVRDIEPYAGIGSRFMRVRAVSTSPTPPPQPTNLDGGVVPNPLGIIISWNGVAFDEANGIDGAFLIERSTQSNADYELIGITNISDPDNNNAAKFIDNDVSTNVPYFYRVRTVSTAGVTPYAINPDTGNPFVGVVIQAN